MPSISVPVRLTVICESSSPSKVLATAKGASLTEVTVMTSLAVTAEIKPKLSVTLNGIVTTPLKSGVGTNTKVAACATEIGVPATTGVTPSAKYSTPSDAVGRTVTVTVCTVPSTSVPTRLTAMLVVSSVPVDVLATAMGASLTVPTLIVMTSVSDKGTPSLSVDNTVKVSIPLKFRLP